MDALFDLQRKKAAPLHGDIFFCDQNEVNEFVSLLSYMLVRHLKSVNENEYHAYGHNAQCQLDLCVLIPILSQN